MKKTQIRIITFKIFVVFGIVEVFIQFLRYPYVGQICISLKAVMTMLALADKYNIEDLVQLRVNYMFKHISKAVTQGVLVSWLHCTIVSFHLIRTF